MHGRGWDRLELRFPEFRGDWSYDTLAKVLREHKRKNGEGCTVFSVSLEKGLVNQVEHMGRSFSAKDTSNYHKVAPFDIVYTKSPLRDYPYGIVKQRKLDEDVAVSPLYGVFSPRNKHIGTLVEAYFDSPYRSKRFIGPLAKKGAKNTINITNQGFLAGKLAVPPSEEEQQKIAHCLGSLDDLIAAHRAKLDALQNHKKGLLQQLFPAPGQTTPKLRFPAFQNAGKWMVKRVDERGEVLAGKALAVNAPGQLRPYLRTKNVYDGTINLSDVRKMPMTDAEFSRFEILDGDILLNEGQSLEFVGRSAIYRCELEERCAMQNQLLRFRAFPTTCTEFAEQAFRKCQKDGTFANIATKTTSVAHLGGSRFSSLELAWPALPEQRKIADCLSAVDALITAQTKQIAALKEHKKGLMQRLFPNPELSKG